MVAQGSSVCTHVVRLGEWFLWSCLCRKSRVLEYDVSYLLPAPRDTTGESSRRTLNLKWAWRQEVARVVEEVPANWRRMLMRGKMEI